MEGEQELENENLKGDGPTTTGRLSSRREHLERLSKETLIDMMLASEGVLTDKTIRTHGPTVTRGFDLELPWEANEYFKLPVRVVEAGLAQEQQIWRIVLISFDLAHPVIGVELYSGIELGRNVGSDIVDLDLSPYDALAYGISRRHAMIQPADNKLLIVDLGSTNGTRLNDVRVRPGDAVPMHTQDIIKLGALELQLRIVEA